MPVEPSGLSVARLSHTERVGIAAARRVHALGGLDLLRMVGTALVAFLLVDFVRLAVTSPLGSADAALTTAMDVLAYLSIGVALWRPLAGLALAAIPLTAALFWTSTSLDAVLLTVVPALALAQVARRVAMAVSALLVVYVVARLLAYSGDSPTMLALFLAVALAFGLALGWSGLLLRERRASRAQAEAQRALEAARIRADERRTLARELHDVIAHHLSTASLQVMGSHGVSDVAVLQRTLATIDRTNSEALTELRLLVRVLRDDPATAASGTELRELAERVPPTQSAAAAERALLAAGFEPDIQVPARADDLAMTVQRTLSRALDEAVDNVIRHAAPHSRCSVRTAVTDQQASLEVRSTLADGSPPPRFGWGLRGLRERISLTGGDFHAGPGQGAEWIVTVSLPLS